MKNLVTFFGVLVKPIVALNNYPVLFKWKNIFVLNLGFLNALGALATVTFATYLYASMFPEIALRVIVWIMFVIPVLVIVFSKLLHFVLLGKTFFENPRMHLAETAFYNQGGQLGFLIGTVIMSCHLDINLFICLDINIVSVALSVALGRIGCYNYGCCHGRETDSFFCVKYTNMQTKILRLNPEMANKPLVPTQLISSVYVMILFGVCVGLMQFPLKAGMISAIFILTYNGFRICIEKVRISFVDLNNKKKSGAFTKIAQILGLVGVSFLMYILLMETPDLNFTEFLSFQKFINAVLINKSFLTMAGSVIVIYVLSYGIHYKKLGQHFEWRRGNEA